MALIGSGCYKESSDLLYGVNENEQEMINKALVIGSGGKCIDGDFPKSSGSGIQITDRPQAVQITAGVLLFFNYNTSNNANLCKVYLQVDSAESYWEVPVEIDPVSKQPFIRVLIPNFVKNGNFKLKFAAGDCGGNISPVETTTLVVTEPLKCGSSFSGSLGITAMVANLGNKAGKVRIQYEMYTIPDRMDIRYRGNWVASTGTPLGIGGYPSCTVSPNGFVSGSNVLEFNYDPSLSKIVEVYVSGCNSGTAWNINIECP
jgi:hypothetical protein